VLLQAVGTGLTVSIVVLARAALSTNTDAVANLNVTGGLGSDADGLADDLVADAARVGGRTL
jgi:hypothetical protein